jgi:hypothetical protein
MQLVLCKKVILPLMQIFKWQQKKIEIKNKKIEIQQKK